MKRELIDKALELLKDSLTPVPHELNNLDWKIEVSTLRERLKISQKNYPMVSRLIKDAIDAGRIKIGNPEASSTKFIYYIPIWA